MKIFKTVLQTSGLSEDIDYGHGRIETRNCSIITDLILVENGAKWKGLVSIFKIERERYFKATAKKENEINYYVITLNQSESIAYGVRKHWGIENKVHLTLDVAFNEDMSRKGNGNAAQNYSNLNRIALNLLKKDDTKVGMKSRRKMAGWSNDYLLNLIRN